MGIDKVKIKEKRWVSILESEHWKSYCTYQLSNDGQLRRLKVRPGTFDDELPLYFYYSLNYNKYGRPYYNILLEDRDGTKTRRTLYVSDLLEEYFGIENKYKKNKKGGEVVRKKLESVDCSLERWRVANNYTPSQLAEELGVSRPGIYLYLKGKSAPNLCTAMKLRKLTGLKFSEILDCNETEFNEWNKWLVSKTEKEGADIL